MSSMPGPGSRAATVLPAGSGAGSPATATATATTAATATATATVVGASGAGATARRRFGAVTARIREQMAGTPGRFRRAAVLCVLVALVFGIGSAQAYRIRGDALDTARADAAQLVRLQTVHTDLVRADANATNAFLVGGLEPVDRRVEYLESLERAASLVAEAARAQPADSRALGAVNSELVRYSGLVESARANNRQGYPVGAQYLRDAGDGLRGNALPVLSALVDDNERRVADAFARAGWAWAWMLTACLLALAVLVTVMVWLARRTHRMINPPLLGAGAAVLVGTILGISVLAAVQLDADRVRDGPYAVSVAAAKARIAAFDAKSRESLTLIARGSGTASEQEWQASLVQARSQTVLLAQLDPAAAGLPAALEGWTAVHREIRTRDDDGAWERAVALATGTGKGSSNATFAAFDDRSGTVLAQSGAATSRELDAAGNWLVVVSLLTVLLGLLAAACSWWGFALRLEEYR